MAIGMVMREAVAQPQHAPDAEIAGEPRLDVGAGEVRIAVGIEQALLGGDGEAGAVDIERAALEDPVAGGDGAGCGWPRAGRRSPRRRAGHICRPNS